MKRLSLIAIAILFCAGCGIIGNGEAASLGAEGRESAQPAAGGGKYVTVYTARHYAADTALFEAFTKKTGIRVVEVKGTAQELVDAMAREGEQSDADLFFTVDGGVLSEATRSGVLQPLRSDLVDANVPQALRDPEHYWVGVTTRARVIVYAKDRVKPEELSTYESLTDERWRGRVLVRSSSNLYNQSLLASFIALRGEEWAGRWAEGVAANLARPPEGGDREQAMAVAAGIGDAAIMNTYYVGQLSASDNPEEARATEGLGVFFPDQKAGGTHINISGIGLARHAKHAADALKLVEYMTSEEGQTQLSRESFEFPVNERAEVPELLKSWGSFKGQRIDFADLGSYNKQALDLFRRAGWS